MTARPSTHHQEVASVARASQPQGRLRHRLHHTPGGGRAVSLIKGYQTSKCSCSSAEKSCLACTKRGMKASPWGRAVKIHGVPRCKNDEDAYLLCAVVCASLPVVPAGALHVFRRVARAPESCDPRPPLPRSPPTSAQSSLDKLCDRTPHAYTNGFWGSSAKSATDTCGKFLHGLDGVVIY